MSAKIFHRACVVCACTLLSACMPPVASISPHNETKSFQERKKELADLTSWHIKGGIAVKEGNDGFTASMLWRQYSAASFNIQFSGPFAVGKVILTKKGNTTTLKEDDKQFSSGNAEQLLKDHTGHSIPVNSLFYWIRALPAPFSISEKSLDEFGHVAKLKQQGWVIEYQRFTHYNDFDVPSKIKLTKGDAKVKLVINSWK